MKTRQSILAIASLTAAVAVFAITAVGPGSLNAQDRSTPSAGMSKEEFNNRVREFLLENPEVIAEAMQKLQEKERVAQKKVLQTVLKTRSNDLLHDKDTPVGGNPEGDVTIVEFFDYNCPYCRSVAPTVTKLKESDPKLRVAYKEFPILSESSTFAAKAGLAAHRQDKSKYVAFHDALMNHKGRLSEKVIMAVAEKSGLDIDRLKADMKRPEIETAIKKNHELARALRINGTPAFVIGDELIPGAADLDTLKKAVAEARQEKAE